ncbi:MAG: DUF503 domain-containing protein [bacterium]|nr:DUF503 domain-containing protein [bacterium]
MITGTCIIKLHIPESNSLKFKRKILKSIIEKVRSKFKVTIAEVDSYDLWQISHIGIACVSNDQKYLNKVLSNIIDYIENINRMVLILDHKTDFIYLS